MLTNFTLKYLLRKDTEMGLFLGSFKQKGSTIIFFNSIDVWKKESLKIRIKSILTLNWNPSETIVQQVGR